MIRYEPISSPHLRVLVHSLLALSLLTSGALGAAEMARHGCDMEAAPAIGAETAHAHQLAADAHASHDCQCDPGACGSDCQTSCAAGTAMAPPTVLAEGSPNARREGFPGPRVPASTAPPDELLIPPRSVSA